MDVVIEVNTASKIVSASSEQTLQLRGWASLSTELNLEVLSYRVILNIPITSRVAQLRHQRASQPLQSVSRVAKCIKYTLTTQILYYCSVVNGVILNLGGSSASKLRRVLLSKKN